MRLPRGLKGPHHMFECRRTNIMGSLVQDASPFLFPCTIEYSLICAAILYVMWKNISKVGFTQPATPPRHHAHAYRYIMTIHSPIYAIVIILLRLWEQYMLQKYVNDVNPSLRTNSADAQSLSESRLRIISYVKQRTIKRHQNLRHLIHELQMTSF